MTTFKLVADATFEAEDIADAFRKLGQYLLDMSNDAAPDLLLDTGTFTIAKQT